MTSPSIGTPGSPSLVHGGIRLRRATGSVVGRATELAAIEETIDGSLRGISGLCIEGEPGIGKSRLLLAAAQMAEAHGFAAVGASADEEFRGPFMMARSIFGSEALRDGASPRALEALERARNVLAGRDDRLEALPPDQRVMRVLDQATMALTVVAAERPLALLLDDLQWADADSLRLLRYLVRTEPSIPVFFLFAIRPEESLDAHELVTLLADMERMGIVRRLKLARLRQPDTGELLRLTLAGAVEPATTATIHSQAEGVPFVIEELAKSYRERGLLQQVDGAWRLSPKAGRLLPSSVRTLIQRRAAHLPEATRAVMADAAVIGRTFRSTDVCAVRAEIGEPDCDPAKVSEILAPAAAAGLLNQLESGSGGDYTFTHDGVMEYAAGLLTVQRLKALHGAIVDLLSAGEAPNPAILPVLARHALAAGDLQRSAGFCVLAATSAIAANAPDEALRLVEEALPVVSTRPERVALLRARDDAYAMLRRPDDRRDGLSELAALAEAAGDRSLELEVRLRRAAALRLDGQHEQAAEDARAVRESAVASGDRMRELAACLELGQDLLRSALGEGFSPSPQEADLDGAEEAFARAEALAGELGDEPALAAATREAGVIGVARVRAWLVESVKENAHIPVVQAVAAGRPLAEMLQGLPIAPAAAAAVARLQRALDLFERLGDRRGAMSTIIAMAYLSWTPEIHVGANPALRIEELRRLASRMRGVKGERERASGEAQMVYGVHVFCRAKVIPDMTVTRGGEAWDLARTAGDRMLEFVSAGGTALGYVDLGDFDEAQRWLDRAAATVASAPTPVRSRELELWRAVLAAAQNDGAAMARHMDRALDMAAREGRPAARCEILATRALLAARIGAERKDAGLLDLAEQSAAEVGRLSTNLPGHSPWEAQAHAALATVAMARGDVPTALDAAHAALAKRDGAQRSDPHFEILLPAARVILAVGEPAEQEGLRAGIQLMASLIAQRTMDEDVRRRWFRARTGRDLLELAGWGTNVPVVTAAADWGRPATSVTESPSTIGDAPKGAPASAALASPAAEQPSPAPASPAPPSSVPGPQASPSEEDRRMLRLLVEGLSDREIAAELASSQDQAAATLVALYGRIGATSRSQAIVFAVRSGIV